MRKSLAIDLKYNFIDYLTMGVNREVSGLPTPVLGLTLRCSLNLPGSKRLHGNLSYILEHGNEKESTDLKYNFIAYLTMGVNREVSGLPTPVLGLTLRCSLNLPGSKRLHGNLSYILEHWNEKESTDLKYNFIDYLTMGVNREGSELPTPVLGLTLRCSLNLPGSKKSRLLQKAGNLSYILEHGDWKESTDPKYNFNTYVTMEANQGGSEGASTTCITLAK